MPPRSRTPSPPTLLPLAKKRRATPRISTTARAKVLDLYRQAADALKAAENFAKQAAESKSGAEKAPQTATDAKAEQKRLKEAIQVSKAAPHDAPGATGKPDRLRPRTRTGRGSAPLWTLF